ncbi:MAG: hypothetical protein KAT70_08415 [Thermoplasmata archaeon]|nr:hypothetical protein [Thermoplasmata archaeon]
MNPTLILLLIGIVPATTVWLYALKPYDERYSEPKAWSSFVIGMVGGSVLGVFQYLFILNGYILDPLSYIIVFSFLFSFAGIMYLVVLLNRPGLQQKHDAMFSGMSLGVSTGAMLAAFINLFLLQGKVVEAGDYLLAFAMCISYALVFGAAGIFAGLFAYHQDRDHILRGFLMLFIYSLVMGPFWWGWGDYAGMALVLAASVVVAVFLFLSAYRTLGENLPLEVEREMRREARKRKRSR